MTPGVPGSQRLIVVVGPSGAGKDSVISGWLAGLHPGARPHRARRTVTRAADAHEDHEPIGESAFRAATEAGEFVFRWQAHGLHYGIRRAELAPLADGGWVVMNGSRGHLPQLLARAPRARVVEIDAPPALRALRLQGRNREAPDDRAARLARVAPHAGGALAIVNDGRLADAVAALDAWWREIAAAQPPA